VNFSIVLVVGVFSVGNKKYAQSEFLEISCNPELKGAAFKKLAAAT
jgi:fumarate reductase subunit C